MFHGGRRGHACRIHAARAIPSIRDGMDVVRTAASVPGPMIDSGHFCFSDNTWQDLAVVPLDEIALSAIRDIQLSIRDAPDNVNIEYMWFEDRGGGLTQQPDRFADHAVRRLLAVAS